MVIYLQYFCYIYLACLLFEQIFCVFPGTFPYKYGLLLHKYYFKSDLCTGRLLAILIDQRIKYKHSGDEYFIGYRYPFGRIGPNVFLIQLAKTNDAIKINIRSGHFTSGFMVFSLLYAVCNADLFITPHFYVSIIMVLVLFILYNYYMAWRIVESIRNYKKS